MKQGWKVKRLDDIIESNVIGLTKNSSEQDIHHKFKYVKMNNITRDNRFDLSKYTCVNAKKEEIEKFSLSEGDFLFNTRNSYELVGKTCLFEGFHNEVILYNNNIMRIRFLKNINPFFINYAFSTEDLIKKLDRLKSGTTNVSAIYYKDLKNLELFVPPLPEQQRIVAILDAAAAAIAKAKANAEQNLKNAKELFESYLQGVFENKGEGWEEKTLNLISENLDSKRVPITKNARKEGPIPYYGASGIVDYVSDYLFDEDLLCISEDGANLLARTYPIAFSISGKTWVNNHAHVLRFKNIDCQKFVELYLNSIKLDDYVSGMAQPKLNQTMLNKIPIPFPPLNNQKNIVLKLDALSAETNKLETIYQTKINDLEELKKSVLQKAFSGELKTTNNVHSN